MRFSGRRFNEGAWPVSMSSLQHRDRFAMLQPIPYESTTAIEEIEEEDEGEGIGHKVTPGEEGKALSINISSGGVLLLMDHAPATDTVLKIHVPTPITHTRTPTLAEVRWAREVPYTPQNSHSLYFVGLKFIFF